MGKRDIKKEKIVMGKKVRQREFGGGKEEEESKRVNYGEKNAKVKTREKS
ncbi:hypothetical protein HG556_08790 [Pasteurella multocida]|nr:hypothetical protein [Pasteurella multocida]